MGLPALALGAVVGGAAAMFSGGDDDDIPNIPITHHEPIKAREEFKPINAMKWLDSVTNEEFSFIRDKDGSLSVNIKDFSGLPSVDSPVTMNNVDVNLPNVEKLSDFTNKYAAAVTNLTARLRVLQDTIIVMENTAPELIAQNAPIIDAFKKASQRAMDRNFDLRKNGIDRKLASMGISNSSTALGAAIALSRERTDAEIMNNLQTAELGQKTKQQSLANLFNIGDNIVKEGTIELNKYELESRNELSARQQDLGRLDLVQKRAAEQSRLNLAKEEIRVGTEFNNRRNRLALMQMRNPNQIAAQLLLGGNDQALKAIQGDNNANYQNTMGQIEAQNAATRKYQVEKATESNPFGEILGQAAATGLSYFTGTLGTNYANQLFPPKNKKGI